MYLQCPLTLLSLKNRTTKTPLPAKKNEEMEYRYIDLFVHVKKNKQTWVSFVGEHQLQLTS